MIHVKFCGLRREEDIEAVNRLKPDFAGFVFAFRKHKARKVRFQPVHCFYVFLSAQAAEFNVDHV